VSGSARDLARTLARPVALLLTLLAAWGVWRHREAVSASLEALRDPPVWTLVALPLATAASILLGGVILKRLLRDRPLPLVDLVALNAAATLFNLLPLKPGLVGRVAWQRRYQGVPVGTSIRVALAAISLSGGVLAIAVASLLAGRATGIPGAAILAAAAVLLGMLTLAPRVGRVAELLWWRSLDLGAWTLRISAGFAALGTDLSGESAVALACVAMATGLIPVVGSALGVREWVIALLAPSLAGVEWEQALAAELVARGAEVAVVALAGGAGAWRLWRVASRHRACTTDASAERPAR